MRLGRREFLAGTAAVGAGLYLAARSRLGDPAADLRHTLAVHDGRTDAGRAFAAQARSAGLRSIDLGADPAAFWNGLRTAPELAEAAQVIGVTGWDERVHLAAFLAERWLRLRHEVRLDCCGLDPRADPHRDLLGLAMADGSAARRLAVAGRGGTLFAWRIA